MLLVRFLSTPFGFGGMRFWRSIPPKPRVPRSGESEKVWSGGVSCLRRDLATKPFSQLRSQDGWDTEAGYALEGSGV